MGKDAKRVAPVVDENKAKAFASIVAQINKKYWEWAALTAGSENLQIKTIPSGSLLLDIATGWWIPEWKITEIYWEEATWKTTLALHTLKQVIWDGWYAALIDAEHAYNEEVARNIWIDVERLIVNQPDYGEQGLEVARDLIASGMIKAIVIDSVAALVPKVLIENAMEDQTMWVHARMMSQACKILAMEASKNWTAIIFINQLRDKIGWYVPMKTTTGWNALKFTASLRLEVKRKEKIERDWELIWNRVAVKVIKNKKRSPWKIAEFNIMFDATNNNFWVDNNEEVFTAGLDLGLIEQGGWGNYTLPNGEKIRGKEKVMDTLNSNPELMASLSAQVKDFILNGKKANTMVDTWITDEEKLEMGEIS